MLVHSKDNPIILNELFGFGQKENDKPISDRQYKKKVDPKYNILDEIPYERFEKALRSAAAGVIKSKYYKADSKPEDFKFKYKNLNVNQQGQPVVSIQILDKGKVVGTEDLPVELRTK